MNRACFSFYLVCCVLALQSTGTAIAASSEKVLHSFGNGTDGVEPLAGLVEVNGTLYGTTEYGGANNGCGSERCGTVFAIDPQTGAETVVYSFCSQQNCTDGWESITGLTDVKGTLYGTTFNGGAVDSKECIYDDTDSCGTVFSVDPTTGAETVLRSFTGYRDDGSQPAASLIDVDGTLYGTTISGGSYNKNCGYLQTGYDRGCGAVFALDPATGAETMLHSFQDDGKDGYQPYAGLIDVNGILYGTTSVGGANTACGPGIGHGCGTVFSLDPSTGAETVLYSFCSQYKKNVCTDGTWPLTGLTEMNGMLYGTTWDGGDTGSGGGQCSDYGCGTVFSLNPATGEESVVYSFCSQKKCADGALPESSLIDVKGTLYGTTIGRGAYGGGTLFSLDPATGKMTVLHAFGKGKDGYLPTGNLIDVNGTLYGTTEAGGTYMLGTVFALAP